MAIRLRLEGEMLVPVEDAAVSFCRVVMPRLNPSSSSELSSARRLFCTFDLFRDERCDLGDSPLSYKIQFLSFSYKQKYIIQTL